MVRRALCKAPCRGDEEERLKARVVADERPPEAARLARAVAEGRPAPAFDPAGRGRVERQPPERVEAARLDREAHVAEGRPGERRDQTVGESLEDAERPLHFGALARPGRQLIGCRAPQHAARARARLAPPRDAEAVDVNLPARDVE